MEDMADRLLSVRIAACMLSTVKRSVTPSTRSSVGHRQNRSAKAADCVCNRHSIGPAMQKGVTASSLSRGDYGAGCTARQRQQLGAIGLIAPHTINADA